MAGPAVLFVITVGIFWKLVLTRQYTWLDNPDFVNQVLPWYQFQAAEWHRGSFPLWDPNHWGGQSLIGQGQPGAAYPLNWILFLLPLKNGWIRREFLDWYFVLVHYMGALFCYWLCRDLKRSRAASLIAAVAFGLSGYCGRVDWPQMLNGAIWAPLVFLFFMRAMRGESPVANAALSGAALGVSFLSGHHQAPIFISLAIGAAWIYFWIRAEVSRSRIAALAGCFAAFLILTSALQVLPIYQYGKLSLRWTSAPDPSGWNDKVPYIAHQDMSLGPLSILGVVIPRIYSHTDPFIGLAIVSLAFVAVAAARNEPMIRLFSGIALGGLFFSLGANAVFHGVVYSIVPGVEKARVPAMAILIFHLGVTVLAAYGFDLYRSKPPGWIWGRRLRWTLAGFAAALYLGILAAALPRPDIGFTLDEAAVAALSALLLASLLAAWSRDQLSMRAAGTLMLLLVIFETGNATGFFYRRLDQPGYFLQRMGESAGIARFLRQQPGPVRADIDRDLLPFNWGDWYGMEEFEGYCGVTRNVIENSPVTLFRNLFAINYWVGAKPKAAGEVEVFQAGNGLKVYRISGARPRVWTAHQIVHVTSAHDGLRALHQPGFDPDRETYLIGAAPKLETCSQPDSVRMVAREANRVVIDADLGCRGMVIASESYFPGWKASVDGKPAPIYEAYAALRGVVVDAGRHRLEMRYRPWTVLLGGAMTAAGLAGSLALWICSRRSRRQRI